jgi:hypothetical protein
MWREWEKYTVITCSVDSAVAYFVRAGCAATFFVEITVHVPRLKIFYSRHYDSVCSTWRLVHCISCSSDLNRPLGGSQNRSRLSRIDFQ